MKIGVMSDSHDNLVMIRKAIELFKSEKVSCVIHAGDFVAPFAVKEIVKFNGDIIAVFGNNDGERKGILSVLPTVHEEPYSFELGGKTIILTHDIASMPDSSSRVPDVVIYGHNHKPEIRREKELFLNPGECGGWLSGKATVAILDLETLEANIIVLGD